MHYVLYLINFTVSSTEYFCTANDIDEMTLARKAEPLEFLHFLCTRPNTTFFALLACSRGCGPTQVK